MSASTPVIKVAAISGSLRRASFHRGLIRSAVQMCEEEEESIPGMRIENVEIDALPLLNVDLEADGKFPAAVETFRKSIAEADAFLFASPEYNYSISAPLKNAIDWASRSPNLWADKPAAIISAGGGSGGGRAQYDLRKVGVFLDLHFINKPEFVVQAFQPPQKFDSDGSLIDPGTKNGLRLVLLALQAFTLRLKNTSG